MQNQEINYLMRKLGSQGLDGVTMVETNLGAYLVRKVDIPLTGPKVKYANGWGKKLRAVEERLFHILLLKSPEYVSKETLIRTVWGYKESVPSDHINLAVRLKDVRQKIEQHKMPFRIQNSKALGYRLLPAAPEKDAG